MTSEATGLAAALMRHSTFHDGVVRHLAARGFTRFVDGTPIQRRTPAHSFEKLFGLDAGIDGEGGAIKRMMAEAAGPYGAPDAAPPEMTPEVVAELLAALRPHVDEAEYARYVELFRAAGLIDADQAADMPPRFPGMPLPGGKKVPLAADAADGKSFDKMFPGADRIGRVG